MTRKKSPLRRAAPKVLGVVLVLALIGTILFSVFRERIERWEYPIQYQEYVTYYADKYDLDPLMLYTFIRTESNFDPRAESDAGARGLMQITEVTFDWIKSKIAPTEPLTFEDLFDPETNIRLEVTLSVIACCAIRTIWQRRQPPTTAAGERWMNCSHSRSIRPTG